MAEASFNNFFNRPFGLNVKSSGKQLRQAGDAIAITAGGVLSPLTNYLEDNEKVFSGEVADQINKTFASSFNIGKRMQQDDANRNGNRTFDNKF